MYIGPGHASGCCGAAVPFLILGLSAAGWNGVNLLEAARRRPAHAASATTGAASNETSEAVAVRPRSW
jgi:hypothetical protein